MLLSFVRFSRFSLFLSPSLFAPSPNDVTTVRSYRVVQLPRNRPTDLTVRKVESSRETDRNTENGGKGRAFARSLARSFVLFPFPSFPFPLVILSSSLPPSIPHSLAHLSSPRSFLSKAGACNYPLARVTTATDCDVLRLRLSKPARRHVPDAGYARARLAGRVTWDAPPLPTPVHGAQALAHLPAPRRDATRARERANEPTNERASDVALRSSRLLRRYGYGCMHSRPRLYFAQPPPYPSCIRSSLRQVSLWKRRRRLLQQFSKTSTNLEADWKNCDAILDLSRD